MKCQNCNNEMVNLGNVSGIIMASYPPQWDETHVCDKCKIKIEERKYGVIFDLTGGRSLDTYNEFKTKA